MTTELSFDGRGINGGDKYRSRLATFTSDEAARKYGALFEAAPDLLKALRLIKACGVNGNSEPDQIADALDAINKVASEAIAKATGKAA